MNVKNIEFIFLIFVIYRIGTKLLFANDKKPKQLFIMFQPQSFI